MGKKTFSWSPSIDLNYFMFMLNLILFKQYTHKTTYKCLMLIAHIQL